MPDEIATALSRYLAGALRVGDLASVLEGLTWEKPSRLGSDALRLLYEYDHGDWNERELREELRRLIEPRPMGIIMGVGSVGTKWLNEAGGIPIRHPDLEEHVGQASAPTRWSRSAQHSGIDIGGTPLVLDR